MQTLSLHPGLAAYQSWQARIIRALDELERWLEGHRRATPKARQQIQRARERIIGERLTVAVTAAAQRSTTELINALFFPELGGRLLPVSADSPCPIEMLWDGERNEPYLRLLPVETRALDVTLTQLKDDPKFWVHYPLRIERPEQAVSTLREILDTKLVSMSEAARLGLSSDGPLPNGQAANAGVRVPKWRHAVISLPHALLRQGLVVIASPGIEALGAEPDFVQSILPAASAVIVVLSYDQGVSRDDLRLWQHHLKGFQSSRQRAMLVALDKVDRAWDVHREGTSLAEAIAEQRRQTSEALGIDSELVVPVSAHQGLLARLRKDDALLRRSAVPALERQIVLRMLETRRRAVGEIIACEVAQLLERNRGRVSSRIARLKTQLDDLERLTEKTEQVISRLVESTREEQDRYLKAVQQFQRSRDTLLQQTTESRLVLGQGRIQSIIDRAERELLGSWTTPGLNRGMSRLLNELRRTMQIVGSESERIRKLVREVYQGFRDELGLEIVKPKVFVPLKYRVEIELLCQELDAFQRRPGTILSSRRVVIARFEEQILSRARVMFEQLRVAQEEWLTEALQPLADGIQEHKLVMEKRLETLARVRYSRDQLMQRIQGMQGQYLTFAQVLTALRNIQNALHADPTANQGVGQRPRLVSG